MITVVVFFLIFQLYRKKRRDTAIKIDEDSKTASDYTIKVKYFPKPTQPKTKKTGEKDYENYIDIDEYIKDFF